MRVRRHSRRKLEQRDWGRRGPSTDVDASIVFPQVVTLYVSREEGHGRRGRYRKRLGLLYGGDGALVDDMFATLTVGVRSQRYPATNDIQEQKAGSAKPFGKITTHLFFSIRSRGNFSRYPRDCLELANEAITLSLVTSRRPGIPISKKNSSLQRVTNFHRMARPVRTDAADVSANCLQMLLSSQKKHRGVVCGTLELKLGRRLPAARPSSRYRARQLHLGLPWACYCGRDMDVHSEHAHVLELCAQVVRAVDVHHPVARNVRRRVWTRPRGGRHDDMLADSSEKKNVTPALYPPPN